MAKEEVKRMVKVIAEVEKNLLKQGGQPTVAEDENMALLAIKIL